MSKSVTTQWVGAADDEQMQRVHKWFAEGRTLAWLPILSRENFPDVPLEVLFYAERCPDRHVWLIEKEEDFLQIPDGITGWLMRKGDKDTDIVVGLWEDALRFVKVIDTYTGAPLTMLSGKVWEVVDADAKGAQRVTL